MDHGAMPTENRALINELMTLGLSDSEDRLQRMLRITHEDLGLNAGGPAAEVVLGLALVAARLARLAAEWSDQDPNAFMQNIALEILNAQDDEDQQS